MIFVDDCSPKSQEGQSVFVLSFQAYLLGIFILIIMMINFVDNYNRDNSDDDQLKLYLRKFALGRLNYPQPGWLVDGLTSYPFIIMTLIVFIWCICTCICNCIISNCINCIWGSLHLANPTPPLPGWLVYRRINQLWHWNLL